VGPSPGYCAAPHTRGNHPGRALPSKAAGATIRWVTIVVSRRSGYRSFVNLSEGKICCILEADDREAVATWFKKMGVPYDDIVPVELEGERGTIEDLREQPALAGLA
jgi:hypothetical protein